MINHLTEKKKKWCRNLDCLRTSGTSGHHISPPSLCEYWNVVTLSQFCRVFSHPVLCPPIFFSSCFYLHVSFYCPAFFSFVFNHVSSLLQFVYPDVFGNLWLVSQNDQFLPHLITYENQGRNQACVLFCFIFSVSIISSFSALQGRKQGKAHFCASLPTYLCYGWKGLKCWKEFYLLLAFYFPCQMSSLGILQSGPGIISENM